MTSAGVIILILFKSFNDWTFSTESFAPLNSFLLWIKVTFFAILDNSIVQSNAESPPPEITIFLSLKISGSRIKYNTPLFSNFSIPSKEGFLGWNPPSPPAITRIGAWCFVPLLVVHHLLLLDLYQP